jgi:hypothetical protein
MRQWINERPSKPWSDRKTFMSVYSYEMHSKNKERMFPIT